MTTGVFRGEIYMTPLHSVGPKIGVSVKTACNYFLFIVNFCLSRC